MHLWNAKRIETLYEVSAVCNLKNPLFLSSASTSRLATSTLVEFFRLLDKTCAIHAAVIASPDIGIDAEDILRLLPMINVCTIITQSILLYSAAFDQCRYCVLLYSTASDLGRYSIIKYQTYQDSQTE